MPKREKRGGWLSFLTRKTASTNKEEHSTLESGPSQKDGVALSSYSQKWFGAPEMKKQESKAETAKEEAIEAIGTGEPVKPDVVNAVEVAPPVAHIEEPCAEVVQEVHKGFVRFLARVGVPVAVAAAACAVLVKLLN